MSFREELIEEANRHYREQADIFYRSEGRHTFLCTCGVAGESTDGMGFDRHRVDALLAYRRSEVCPTCRGRGDLSCDCIDGRRSVDSPRLAVVGEQEGFIYRNGEYVWNPVKDDDEQPRPVFSLHQEEAER